MTYYNYQVSIHALLQQGQWDLVQHFVFPPRNQALWDLLEMDEQDEQNEQERTIREWLFRTVAEYGQRQETQPHAIRTLLRLFPEESPAFWSRSLRRARPPLSLLRSLLVWGKLAPDFELALYVLNYDRATRPEILLTMDELLLAGLDINVCEEVYRQPLLQEYLYILLYSHYLGVGAGRSAQDLRTFVPYLLQKGADPLLQDASGTNAIQHVQQYEGIPTELKQWLLAELERYA